MCEAFMFRIPESENAEDVKSLDVRTCLSSVSGESNPVRAVVRMSFNSLPCAILRCPVTRSLLQPRRNL
jgi:hypothetical protein